MTLPYIYLQLLFPIFLGVIFAFIITLFLIPFIISFSEKKGLFDLPDDRKLHKKPISRMGGIGIVSGFLGGTLTFCKTGNIPFPTAILISFIPIITIGLWDDIKGLSPKGKLIGQGFAAMCFVYLSEMGSPGGHDFLNYLNLKNLITVVFIILVTNSMNLIDGLDGLAASLSIASLGVISGLFFIQGLPELGGFFVIFIGSLSGFYLFNREPAKIFMGDLGSLSCGFLLSLSILIIRDHLSTDFNSNKLFVALSCIVAIPILDAIRVIVSRVLKGKKPFGADKTHLHHILIKNGNLHQSSVLLISGLQIILILIGLSWFRKSFVSNLVVIFGGFLLTLWICNNWVFPKLKSKIERLRKMKKGFSSPNPFHKT